MSFSFGAPSSAPATGLSGGFNFGPNKPATPGFGLTATSQPSTGLFGSPATSAPAFGSTATPAFGSTAAAPTFGATSTPTFGATSTPNFGATSTPSFGATPTPSFGATSTPSFGGTGLGTGGLNFGAGTNTATASGLNFGTTTSAGGGLGGLGGFGFNTTQSTAQNTGFGLLGSTSTTTTSSLLGARLGTTNVTGTQPSITAAPSLGLGGFAPSTSGIGIINTTNSADVKEQQPKQNKLPNEILTSVDSFKEFVKKQKTLSSDVMRVSVKPFHKVSAAAEATLRAASSLSGAVARARAHSRRLRAAAADALAAAERAARDVPGSELEGSAPPAYVKELISELEQQLIAFRKQMDVADKQMQSSPKLLSEQELTLGIRRMHESFVALAARLQAVHAQVEAQKEQYLNLRKYILKDPTNVFENHTVSTSLDQILRNAEGNRKKIKFAGFSDISHGSAVLTDPRAALGNIQQLAGPTPFTYHGSAASPFPAADNTGSSWHQPQGQPSFSNSLLNASSFSGAADGVTFQLQKPPKRGKQ